jgi:hypothetical protein
MLLKKKKQKILRKWRRTSEGLGLGLGGAVLRVDAMPQEWRITLKTL